MPKYRKFYTKTVESLDINDMPDDFTRLLWVMLPLGLCAEGRGVDNPSWVKSKIFPLRLDVTFEMIEDALAWYTERGMVQRYEVEGRHYFCIPTWHRYQGNTERESETNYPPPPDEPVPESGQTHDKLTTSSRSDAQVDAQVDAEGDAPVQESRTPPARYPALAAYVEETGRKLPKGKAGEAMCDELVTTIGEAPAAIQLERDIIRAGARLGWNPRNLDWILDFYKRGKIPERNRNNGTGAKRTKGEPPPVVDGWEQFDVPIPGHIDPG